MEILKTPVPVNGLFLPNRLVMPPMATNKAQPDGTAGGALLAYYGEKSRGGHIGLIITEHAYISPEGKAHDGQLSAASDECVPGFLRLTETIHQNHTKVFAQINHAGGAATQDVTGYPPLSASSYPHKRQEGSVAREMDGADIGRVIRDFALAAKRMKKAGFDGVEIHAAHGYLLNQFYSPLINRRTDEYTGSTLEGRVRLLGQVVRAVREAVGAGYPVALRLGACDYADGGTTVEDSAGAAAFLEEAGADLLDISGGLCGFTNPNSAQEGYFREITAAVKARVRIPVLLTGGVVTKEGAEHLLASGAADLIGVGRAILQDSGWAERAMRS